MSIYIVFLECKSRIFRNSLFFNVLNSKTKRNNFFENGIKLKRKTLIIKALIQKKDYLCSVFVGNFGEKQRNLIPNIFPIFQSHTPPILRKKEYKVIFLCQNKKRFL